MPDRTPLTSPDGQPLLVGRLTRDLLFHAHCPACGTDHTHGWNPAFDVDQITDRKPHCPGTTLLTPNYWIAIDPAFRAEARRYLAQADARK